MTTSWLPASRRAVDLILSMCFGVYVARREGCCVAGFPPRDFRKSLAEVVQAAETAMLTNYSEGAETIWIMDARVGTMTGGYARAVSNGGHQYTWKAMKDHSMGQRESGDQGAIFRGGRRHTI